MASPIENLFTLQGDRRDIFYRILESVDIHTAEDSTITQSLSSILEQGWYTLPELQRYDRELVEEVLNTVVQALKDDTSLLFLAEKLSHYHERVIAAQMIGWFGDRARGFIWILVELASRPTNATEAARRAILLIGQTELAILSALSRSVQESDDMKFRHLWELATLAGYTSLSSFQDAVQRASESDNADLREAAADAISALDSEARLRLSSVLKRLENDPQEYVRKAAISALSP